MSPLLRAAAAAARRGLGRMPSAVAATTTKHGRRTMASSSSAAGTETMEGTWLLRLGSWWCVGTLINRHLETKMRRIAGEAHVVEINGIKEEVNGIREDIKTLRESTDELLDILKRHRRRTRQQE